MSDSFKHQLETVLPRQDATYLGIGLNGELIIEQDNNDPEQPDVIIIAAENIDAILFAIRRLCGK